jgi:hypothetical protein
MADIVPGQPELIRYGGFALATDFPNLLTNGDLLLWAGGLPVGWDELIEGDGDVSEVGPGEFAGGAGSGAANIESSAPFANRATLIQNGVTSVGGIAYEVYVTYWENGGSFTGRVQIGAGGSNSLVLDGSGVYSVMLTPSGVGNYLVTSSDHTEAVDITCDDMFLRVGTPWVWVRDWNLTSNISAVWVSSESATERSILQTFGSNAGEVYQVIFNISSLTLDDTPTTVLEVSVNGGGVNNIYSGGTYTLYLVAGATAAAGLKFQVKNDTAADTFTLKGVSVKHVPSKGSTDSETLILTGTESVGDTFTDIGPNGTYRRTTTIQDGKPTWESDEEHPDGEDGTTTWYIWWDVDTGSWIIGQNIDTVGANDWTFIGTIEIPIGSTFTPNGNGAGDGVLYGGPVSGERRDTRSRSRYNG